MKNGCAATPSVSWLAWQSIDGLLSPTPRGSKPTMSKRSLTPAKRPEPMARTVSAPLPPGPPKLTNSEPMRWAWSRAGMRDSASVIWSPPGCV